jgi:hypothetical protein
MTKARAWVKEHEGKTYEPHEVSQQEIIDEIDYLITLIDKGISDEVKISLQEFAKRIPGGDIPVKIEESITFSEIREAIKRLTQEEK